MNNFSWRPTKRNIVVCRRIARKNVVHFLIAHRKNISLYYVESINRGAAALCTLFKIQQSNLHFYIVACCFGLGHLQNNIFVGMGRLTLQYIYKFFFFRFRVIVLHTRSQYLTLFIFCIIKCLS